VTPGDAKIKSWHDEWGRDGRGVTGGGVMVVENQNLPFSHADPAIKPRR
jgi:hypothetical protein